MNKPILHAWKQRISARAKSTHWFSARSALGIVAGLSYAFSTLAASLNIPTSHPRLWFNDAARLNQARSYFATTPFTPGGEDDGHYEFALRGLLQQNTDDCANAINWLMNFTVTNPHRGAHNPLRWQGENAMLIYDWCYNSLSEAQKTTLIARWNAYIKAQNDQASLSPGVRWGGRNMEGNNYFWGQMRNSLLWGIVSYHENPEAQSFIDHALDVRFDNWFEDYRQDFGIGGTLAEGPEYGVTMFAYSIIAFAAARDYGIDAHNNPFFRDAFFQTIYATTAQATTVGSLSPRFQIFPSNDDATFRGGGILTERTYFGDFFKFWAHRHGDNLQGRYARDWLARTSAPQSWLFRALSAPGSSASINQLPLDYYSPGAVQLVSRDRSNATTQVQLALGMQGGVGHRHDDAGSYQMWRNGRWLSRETAGYSNQIVGWRGVGMVDVGSSEGHNTLMFEGYTGNRWEAHGGPTIFPPGQPRGENPDGVPVMLRLQSDPDFSFAAVDLTPGYRATSTDIARAFDWPYAARAIREFVFLRELGALVIFDRATASSESLQAFYRTAAWRWPESRSNTPRVPAEQVRKTFVHHFETEPTITTNLASAAVGNQFSDLHMLLPSTGQTRRVLSEGSVVGQQRLEIDHAGVAETVFLNIVAGRDSGAAPLQTELEDLGDRWRVRISNPNTQAAATVEFRKGPNSQGGSVTIAARTVALHDSLQGYTIGDAGPVWAQDTDVLFANGFE